MPTIPSTLSARTLEQLDRFLARVDDPPIVLPFLSMIDRRRTVHRQLAADLVAGWPNLLPTQVPNIATVERMGVERAPLAVFAPSARGTYRVPRPLGRDRRPPLALTPVRLAPCRRRPGSRSRRAATATS